MRDANPTESRFPEQGKVRSHLQENCRCQTTQLPVRAHVSETIPPPPSSQPASWRTPPLPTKSERKQSCKIPWPASLAEVCKCSEIDAQQVREPNPENDRKNCARQGGTEALLDVGSEKVKSFDGENGKADRDHPVGVGP